MTILNLLIIFAHFTFLSSYPAKFIWVGVDDKFNDIILGIFGSRITKDDKQLTILNRPSLACQKHINQMHMIIVNLSNNFMQDPSTFDQIQLQLTQYHIISIELYYFRKIVGDEQPFRGGGRGCGLVVEFFEDEVLGYLIDLIAFGEEGAMIDMEIVVEVFYQFITSKGQTHAHFVLEMHLHVEPQITTQMHLHLQSCIQSWLQPQMTVLLMSQFRSNLASIRAIVNIVTFLTEFINWIVFPAVKTLRSGMGSIFVDCYLVPPQDGGGVLSIQIKECLGVLVEDFEALVEVEGLSEGEGLDEDVGFDLFGQMRDVINDGRIFCRQIKLIEMFCMFLHHFRLVHLYSFIIVLQRYSYRQQVLLILNDNGQ